MKLYKMKRAGGITFYLHYRLNGKLIRERIPNIQDEKTAEVYMAQRQIAIAKGQVGLPTHESLTVSKCLRSLLESKKVTCTPDYVKIVEARVKQIEAFFGASAVVKHLTERQVNAFRAMLRDAGDVPDTINRKVTLLKSACERAVVKKLIGTNPLEGLGRLSDDRPPVWQWLTTEEIDKLLSALKDGVEKWVERKNGRNYFFKTGKNIRLYRLVVFLLNTGCRTGEALSLRWQDVSFEAGTLGILTGKSASKGRRVEMRHLPMNAAVREVLKEMRGEKTGERVFQYANNLRRDFVTACDYAGIRRVRPHDLRHSAASHMVQAGVPLLTVSEILGHKTPSMTKRYAHLAPKQKADAVGTLNFGAQKTETARIMEVAG